MATSIYPAKYSFIRSVQRGYSSTAANISISEVNMSKTFVRSFSDGASGTAAVTGTSSGTYSASGGSVASTGGTPNNTAAGSWPNYSGNRTFSASGTAITTARYGVTLTSSTLLFADGPCYWEVVEYI